MFFTKIKNQKSKIKNQNIIILYKTMSTTPESRKLYRMRIKRSICRNKTPGKCKKVKGCKYASKGTQRKFCRKSRNTRRKA